MYVAETATPKMRGLLGACVQLMVTFFSIFMFFLVTMISFCFFQVVFGVMLVIVMGLAENWRWVSIACLLMVIIIIIDNNYIIIIEK